MAIQKSSKDANAKTTDNPIAQEISGTMKAISLMLLSYPPTSTSIDRIEEGGAQLRTHRATTPNNPQG